MEEMYVLVGNANVPYLWGFPLAEERSSTVIGSETSPDLLRQRTISPMECHLAGNTRKIGLAATEKQGIAPYEGFVWAESDGVVEYLQSGKDGAFFRQNQGTMQPQEIARHFWVWRGLEIGGDWDTPIRQYEQIELRVPEERNASPVVFLNDSWYFLLSRTPAQTIIPQ